MKTRLLRLAQDSYRKNWDDIRALGLRLYPDFVYRRVDGVREGQIPVFAFHSARLTTFESQLKYLVQNGYRTLRADELHEVITGKRPLKPKSVVLTFDDGRGSLWSVGYPLLKKYGLTAISFIVPGVIDGTAVCHPNLDDVWNGKAGHSAVEGRDRKFPFCTWEEVRVMSQSGIIDFQSHSMYHHSIYVSPRLVDFINPSFRPSILTSTLNPVIRLNGEDVFLHDLEMGRPIYEWAPGLSDKTRYVEDDRAAHSCIEYVKDSGGSSFFKKSGWRRRLLSLMADRKGQGPGRGRFESDAEKMARIKTDLASSKTIIEERINAPVRHLCYPWYVGSELAVEMSRQAGYIANYWGVIRESAGTGIGRDPYHIGRMSDDYLLTLPGQGRTTLLRVLLRKVIVNVERHARTEQRQVLSQ